MIPFGSTTAAWRETQVFSKHSSYEHLLLREFLLQATFHVEANQGGPFLSIYFSFWIVLKWLMVLVYGLNPGWSCRMHPTFPTKLMMMRIRHHVPMSCMEVYLVFFQNSCPTLYESFETQSSPSRLYVLFKRSFASILEELCCNTPTNKTSLAWTTWQTWSSLPIVRRMTGSSSGEGP